MWPKTAMYPDSTKSTSHHRQLLSYHTNACFSEILPEVFPARFLDGLSFSTEMCQ